LEENLIKLAFHEWKATIKGVFASKEFKALKKTPDEDEIWKRREAEEKWKEKEQKKVEQAEKKQQKQVEQEERKREKKIQKTIKNAKKAEKECKLAERKAAAAEKRDAAERKKAETALQKQQKAGNGRAQGKQIQKDEAYTTEDDNIALTDYEMPIPETNLKQPATPPQQDTEAHENIPICPRP